MFVKVSCGLLRLSQVLLDRPLYKNLLDPAVEKELVVGNKSGAANLLLYSPVSTWIGPCMLVMMMILTTGWLFFFQPLHCHVLINEVRGKSFIWPQSGCASYIWNKKFPVVTSPSQFGCSEIHLWHKIEKELKAPSWCHVLYWVFQECIFSSFIHICLLYFSRFHHPCHRLWCRAFPNVHLGFSQAWNAATSYLTTGTTAHPTILISIIISTFFIIMWYGQV